MYGIDATKYEEASSRKLKIKRNDYPQLSPKEF
jgi:hypothetical protein